LELDDMRISPNTPTEDTAMITDRDPASVVIKYFYNYFFWRTTYNVVVELAALALILAESMDDDVTAGAALVTVRERHR